MNYFELNISVSKQYLMLMVILHLATLLAIGLSSILFFVKIIISLLIIAHAYYQIDMIVLQRCSSSVIQCRLVDGAWILVNKRGETIPAVLLMDSVISSRLIILNFHIIDHNKRKTVVIFHDALPKMVWKSLKRHVSSD